MSMPIADAIPVIYVLCRQWNHEREKLAAMGVKNPDRLDEILFDESPVTTGRAAKVIAMGGEVG